MKSTKKEVLLVVAGICSIFALSFSILAWFQAYVENLPVLDSWGHVAYILGMGFTGLTLATAIITFVWLLFRKQ